MSYDILFEDINNLKLKGLNASTLKALKKLEIDNLYDLFYYFPKYYENSAVYKKIAEVKNEEVAIIEGKVISINKKFLPGKRIMVTIQLMDQTGIIDLLWFNNRYIYSNIKYDDKILVTGKIKKFPKCQMINPSYKKVYNENNFKEDSQLEPI